MKTRKQYLDGECTHREYYAQFVNEQTKRIICTKISWVKLLKSTDEHFNDIPLKKWDNCGICIDYPLLKKCGESHTLAVENCIKKEAAKQLIEEYNNKEVNEIQPEDLQAAVNMYDRVTK
jgi:hypothetical protein